MKLLSMSSVYSTPAIYKSNKAQMAKSVENNQKLSTPAFGAAYPRFYYHPDLIEVVKDNSKNNEKHFDMHFARLLCSALTSYPEPNPPVGIIADELKHFISLDPKQETDVLTGFSNVLRLCPIQKDSQDFEELFPLSFNDKTSLYDKNANDVLCEILQDTRNLQNKKEIIKEYFQQIKDEQTGEIKKGFPRPKQFLSGLKK